LGLGACRDATEITLKIRTDLPCQDKASWKGVAIYVGKPGQDVEETSATTVVHECDADGSVGSLVIVPSGSKSEGVGVRVVAGIEVEPEACKSHDNYAGCVVARRALRFNPHHDLELDVELASDCVSVGCDSTHSCKGGSCQPAASVDPELEPDPVTPEAASVRCGDDGVRCPTNGNLCCLSVDFANQKAKGDCRPMEQCPVGNIVLQCDDDSDCKDPSDPKAFCNLAFSATSPDRPYHAMSIGFSHCSPATQEAAGEAEALGLCEKHERCIDDRFACRDSQDAETHLSVLPHYFWCEAYLDN
jgi:hypothetical protein